MTKKKAATKKAADKPAARTRRAAPEPDQPGDPIGAGEGAKAANEANRKAAHVTRKPIPVAPNPPPQPAMIPAKQVQGATGQAVPIGPGRPAADPEKAIRVQATDIGYYDDVIRRVGDVFDIHDESAFSKKWMIRVPEDTPERVTGSNEALERDRKAAQRPTGDTNVLE